MSKKTIRARSGGPLASARMLAPAALGLLLFAAGCPVDVNPGDPPGDDDPTPPPECDAATTARVRIFHGAPGTPVEKLPGKPERTPNLQVFRADKMAPLASLAFGKAAVVSICPGTYDLAAQLDNDDEARATAAAVTIAAGEKITLVAAGFVAPETGQDGLHVIVQHEPFPAEPDGTSRLVLVNAAPDLPTVAVELSAEHQGAEAPSLARYDGTPALEVAGDKALPIDLLDGETVMARFGIEPRFPAGANLYGIVFDRTQLTPEEEAMMPRPKPKAKLFLTGDDPLIGNVAGGGITFKLK